MNTPSPHRRRLLPLVGLLGLALATPQAISNEVPADAQPTDPLRLAATALEIRPPITAGPLTIVPLWAPAPAPTARVEMAQHPYVHATLTHDGQRRPHVRLENDAATPALVSAGAILARLDAQAPDDAAPEDTAPGDAAPVEVIVPRDLVVPPEGSVDLRAVAGEFDRAAPEGEVPLRLTGRLAPSILRSELATDPDAYDVKRFLALFTDVVGDEGDLPTIQAVLTSDFATRLEAHVTTLLHAPDLRAQRTIGYASAVRGRLHALELFDAPRTLRAHLSQRLRAHAIRAQALAVRAERLGIELAPVGAAAEGLSGEITRLVAALGDLFDDLDADTADGSVEFQAKGLVGHGVMWQGALVHVALHPHDPHERAVFSGVFDEDAGEADDADGDAYDGAFEGRVRRGGGSLEEKRLQERRSGQDEPPIDGPADDGGR